MRKKFGANVHKENNFNVLKTVEIPVEKPVLYRQCEGCNQTAYQKAKEKYDIQREKLDGRYKAKTAMHEAWIFYWCGIQLSLTFFGWYVKGWREARGFTRQF